jgi:hypothetical protein
MQDFPKIFCGSSSTFLETFMVGHEWVDVSVHNYETHGYHLLEMLTNQTLIMLIIHTKVNKNLLS